MLAAPLAPAACGPARTVPSYITLLTIRTLQLRPRASSVRPAAVPLLPRRPLLPPPPRPPSPPPLRPSPLPPPLHPLSRRPPPQRRPPVLAASGHSGSALAGRAEVLGCRRLLLACSHSNMLRAPAHGPGADSISRCSRESERSWILRASACMPTHLSAEAVDGIHHCLEPPAQRLVHRRALVPAVRSSCAAASAGDGAARSRRADLMAGSCRVALRLLQCPTPVTEAGKAGGLKAFLFSPPQRPQASWGGATSCSAHMLSALGLAPCCMSSRTACGGRGQEQSASAQEHVGGQQQLQRTALALPRPSYAP